MKTKSQIKILIVEDETALLYALNARLSLKGYQIKTATNLEKGFNEIVNDSISILILDTIINNKSSLDLIEKIKLDKNLKNIPIILITHEDRGSDLGLYKKFGINQIINKTKHTLEEIIEFLDDVAIKMV